MAPIYIQESVQLALVNAAGDVLMVGTYRSHESIPATFKAMQISRSATV